MRLVGLAPDGTVYLPAAFAGDEPTITDRAIRDGQRPASCHSHTFVSLEWLARVAPDKADLWARVERAAIYFYTRRLGR
jgi:hypothetical protein